MRTITLALAAAIGALGLAGAAQAEDAPAFKLAFNVGANTDYVFRGISQTNEDPSVFGGIDATIGSIGYAGTWLSNVDFGNSTDIEFDLYAGIKPTLGAINFDIGILYYGYTNQPKGSNEDYFEGKIAASTALGPATIGAAFFYSPEFFGKTGDATYYELNGALPLGKSKFTVSGAVGYQQVKGPADYTTWNVGVGYALTDHIGLDVRYFDTDEHKFGSIYDSRVVGGIKVIW